METERLPSVDPKIVLAVGLREGAPELRVIDNRHSDAGESGPRPRVHMTADHRGRARDDSAGSHSDLNRIRSRVKKRGGGRDLRRNGPINDTRNARVDGLHPKAASENNGMEKPMENTMEGWVCDLAVG